jgi:hypothetical protein
VSSAADELGRRNIWNRRSNISVSSIIHWPLYFGPYHSCPDSAALWLNYTT